jgi:exodeoxyribonuclease VII large subunit
MELDFYVRQLQTQPSSHDACVTKTHPARELTIRHNRFADLQRRLVGSSTRSLERTRHRFERIEGMLRVRGPDATLRRGYSITMNEHGKIIRTISAVRPKMKIRTQVSDGEFGSEIR